MPQDILQTQTETFLFGVKASLTGRYWTSGSIDDQKVRALSAPLGGDDLLARLMAQRDVQPGEVEAFLNPSLRHSFPDPSSFADMDRAAELTLEAILDGKKVTVFADYDVDGATSSAILTRYFRAWGRVLDLYVPDRLTEGYGPSPAAFRALKEGGSDMVITVDCGAAAREALAEAVMIDLPVIVLDHHLMHGAVPDCAALVNPNRPDCPSNCGYLSGAGVAYIFVAALNRLARARGVLPPSGHLPNLIDWLDLCALGTLCDVAPLVGVNRAFVRQGLKLMSARQNIGLKALGEIAGLQKIDSTYHAGFILGPRLNAGGRIGDPWLAAKLLASEDWQEAIDLSERLHELNDQRKLMEQHILSEAKAQAERLLAEDTEAGVLVVGAEGWHPGVIGIVAGRLKEAYHRPAIVIGWGEHFGSTAKGSARSVTGINIGDAICEAAELGLIQSGGGHAMAAGLSLDPGQMSEFRDWLNDKVKTQADTLNRARALPIHAQIALGAASLSFCQTLEVLGPFGAGAPRPIFASSNVAVTYWRIMADAHIKFTIEDMTGRLECVAWRAVGTPLGDAIRRKESLHIAGHLAINQWRNQQNVQMELIDAAVAS